MNKRMLPLQIGAAILIVLIILNPSYKAFKEYCGTLNASTQKMIYKRTGNYLVCSFYESHTVIKSDGYWEVSGEKELYFAMGMNFFRIK